MTDLRKAAEMAIEVLERTGTVGNYAKEQLVIQRLRQALAQPEEKMRIEGSGKLTTKPYPDGYESEQEFREAVRKSSAQPDGFVYSGDRSYRISPLTGSFGIGDAPEKTSKQEPGYSEIAKTQLEAAKTALNRTLEDATVDAVHKLWNESQKPVAHLWECIGRWTAMVAHDGEEANLAPPDWLVGAVKAATAPPKREWVGLTDEVIWDIKMKGRDLEGVSRSALMRFAREIEAASKEINT